MLVGRTEKASVEQAVLAPSLMIAAKLRYAEFSVKLADCFCPASPDVKVSIWLPPITAVLAVQVVSQ